MKRKASFPPLTDEEEALIQAGIANDPDNPEITDEQFAQMRPFAEVFPEMAASLRRMRGRQKAPTKRLISLRLDQDVIEGFKATGPGWQARMNAALRAALPAEA